jgi:hypothetical protein
VTLAHGEAEKQTQEARQLPGLLRSRTSGLLGLIDRLEDLRYSGGRGSRFGIGFADVDTALEESAIFNADAGRSYIAGEGAFGANIHAVSSGDIAANLTQNDNLASGDAGGDLAVATHGNAIAVQVDAALDFAVDEEGFRAGDFAFDKEAFADGSLVGRRYPGAARGFNRRRGGWGGPYWLWRWGRNGWLRLGRFPHTIQLFPFLVRFRIRVWQANWIDRGCLNSNRPVLPAPWGNVS